MTDSQPPPDARAPDPTGQGRRASFGAKGDRQQVPKVDTALYALALSTAVTLATVLGLAWSGGTRLQEITDGQVALAASQSAARAQLDIKLETLDRNQRDSDSRTATALRESETRTNEQITALRAVLDAIRQRRGDSGGATPQGGPG